MGHSMVGEGRRRSTIYIFAIGQIIAAAACSWLGRCRRICICVNIRVQIYEMRSDKG